VTVTPRVSGYIVDIPFKEGGIVHKGDLLFQIDPRPYQDAYEQAVGLLQQAQSNQQLQDATFDRQQRLRQTGVIAKVFLLISPICRWTSSFRCREAPSGSCANTMRYP
jgi:multidrug efflux pump subunit AcrA (membrane-fusion protein)